MPPHAGLLYTSLVILAVGVLFYVTSVAGLFWPKPTPWDDIGLYAVTVVLVGFGAGGLLLRWTKLHGAPAE